MSKQRQTLTQKIVDELLAEIDVTCDEIDKIHKDPDKNRIWNHVYKRVRKLAPPTLGIIAANGHGLNSPRGGYTMYSIHRSKRWIGPRDNGKSLLRDIATTALICLMYDRLQEMELEALAADALEA